MEKEISNDKNIELLSVNEFAGIEDGYERLWTPQRVAYVKGTSKFSIKHKNHECPFCKSFNDPNSYILKKGKLCYAILNLFPYNTAHTLITTYKHIANFIDLSENEIVEMAKLKKETILTIQKVYKPDGWNMGMNNERIAGAGIPDHIHEHIIPRWVGDSNFFPIIAKARSVTEILKNTQNKLKKAWIGL